MKNALDGGEAVVQAFRNLKVDYVMSSPGSEWPSVWEAFARQEVNKTEGPIFFSCAHETLAVDLAIGYTLATGRAQAVMLHAGVGLLQGAMAIDSAQRLNIPMVVLSGEALTYGESSEIDPGPQWQGLSVVGGVHRLAEPIVKWSIQASSTATLHETVMRAGEIAQRNPAGPTFVNVPIETGRGAWSPPRKFREAVPGKMAQVPQSEIERVADLLISARNPVITTERAGRRPEGYHGLVSLAELLAIPVVEGTVEVANFPKNHPLHQGYSLHPFTDVADIVLVVRSRMPWYPPYNSPPNATVIVLDENPLRPHLAYQNLQADIFLEGDVDHALETLAKTIRSRPLDKEAIAARLQKMSQSHQALEARALKSESDVVNNAEIHPITLCAALGRILPEDTMYVDETITHRNVIQHHLNHRGPKSYFRCAGGLGQGVGIALGLKLAEPERLAVPIVGDGTFMYGPVIQSLALSHQAKLPILIIIFNNHGYLGMKLDHRRAYPNGTAASHDVFPGYPVTELDYSELVKPFGGYGRRIERPADLEPALIEALAAVRDGRTAILDVIVSP